MGTNSYLKDCPKCSGNDCLNCWNDTNSEESSGECVHCGYTFWTECNFKSFEEINEIRKNGYNLKPLTKKEYNQIQKEISK
jgi:Zn ribbon nucleic-acid-binding protein